MAEPAQTDMIPIPKGFDAFARQEIGKAIVQFIKDRTRKGLDINNKPFDAYSKSYKNSLDFKNAGKTGNVNLRLTGEMMNNLEVLSTGVGFIKIGFTDQEDNDKASFSRQHGREFVGISTSDLKMILKRFDSILSKENVTGIVAESFAEGLIRRLFNAG